MRKLRIVWISVFFTFISMASGQLDSSKHLACFSANAGIAIPMQDFNSVSKASTGFTVNISASFPVHKSNLELCALVSYGQNQYDPSTLVAGLQTVIIDSSKYGTYRILSGLGGIYCTFPSRIFLFGFRILGGGLFFFNPEIMYSENNLAYSYQSATFRIKQQEITALAFDVGVSMHYQINRRLLFSFSLDLLASQKQHAIIETITGSAGTDTYIYDLKAFLLNATVGISYMIGNI